MITGNLLRDAVISGANNIQNCRVQVDELNVFPVPDGDTGTNMSLTISNAAKELGRVENETVYAVSIQPGEMELTRTRPARLTAREWVRAAIPPLAAV